MRSNCERVGSRKWETAIMIMTKGVVLLAALVCILAAACAERGPASPQPAWVATPLPSQESQPDGGPHVTQTSPTARVPLSPEEATPEYTWIPSGLSRGDYIVFCARDPAGKDPGRPFSFFYMTREGAIEAVGPAVGSCSWSVLSPTGRFLAITDIESSPPISVVDLETGEQNALSNSVGCYDPVWSPDEKSLLASCPESRFVALGILEASSTQWVDYLSLGFCTVPSWSPDGLRVGFACDNAPYPGSRAYIEEMRCTNAASDCSDQWDVFAMNALSPLAWSPDGQTVAGGWQDEEGIGYLVLFDPWQKNEGPLRTLLRVRDLAALAWSPDGGSIAFIDGPGGNSGSLNIISLEGGTPRTLKAEVQASQLLWLSVP